jgi:hypothetical protein
LFYFSREEQQGKNASTESLIFLYDDSKTFLFLSVLLLEERKKQGTNFASSSHDMTAKHCFLS